MIALPGQGTEVGADSLRAIIDSVLRNPVYHARAARDPWAPVRRAWFSALDWLDQLRATNPLAYQALVWVLVAILAAIVAHAMWIASRTLRAGTAPAARRVVETPSSPRDAAWYAAEAGRLLAAGRIAEAMQADFLRLVLELDARSVARFHPSKTPIEYVREASMAPEAKAEFRQLVATLYVHAFARVATTRDAWEQWRVAARADRYAPAH